MDFKIPIAIRYNAMFDVNGNYLETKFRVINLQTTQFFEYPSNPLARKATTANYKAWKDQGISGPYKPMVDTVPKLLFNIPEGVDIKNILLFDTYDGDQEEPLNIGFDNSDEFSFDVGGTAEIQSCKQEFVSSSEMTCSNNQVLYYDKNNCRPVGNVIQKYATGLQSGP